MARLFEEASIGDLALKNRVVRTAMGDHGADDAGHLGEKDFEGYGRVAKGGAAAFITGYSWVYDYPMGGRGKMMGAYDGSFAPELERLTAIAHAHGCAAIQQLAHIGSATTCAGVDVIGPSAVPGPYNGQVPRPMEADDFARVTQAVAEAVGIPTIIVGGVRGREMAERIGYARRTGEAAHALSDMVGNMLRLNKLENQAIFPEPVEFDLSEQLAECVLAFSDAFEGKGVQLDADLVEGVRVEGDVDLLVLAWNNLLGNALKFTDSGGRVRVTLEAEGGRVRVEVADDGCGIDPAAGARIFDKFYQADPSRATRGNGLGLALVKRVVDLHGGEIAVESEPGRGSTFTVALPAETYG